MHPSIGQIENNLNRNIRVKTAIKFTILSLYVVLQLLNINTGWADNGDFFRVASWFSSDPRPVDIQSTPEVGSDDYLLRFNYYHPVWEYDLKNKSTIFSSVVLLWLPGIVLNRVFVSTSHLLIPLISMGARVGIFCILLLVFYWIDKHSNHPVLNYISIAFPLVLLFSSSDVAAFYNSYYQETATIVFIPFLIAIVLFGIHQNKKNIYYLIYAICVFLVVTSKTASFFWAILAFPLIYIFSEVRSKLQNIFLLIVPLVIIPVYLCFQLTILPATHNSRPYIALFNGTLRLSDHPQAQLNDLGIPEMIECVGVDYFNPEFIQNCSTLHRENISYLTVAKTMINEPRIIARQLMIIANTMQNYSLNLGRYAINYDSKSYEGVLNLWSKIKSSFFPKGYPLLLFSLFAGVAIGFGLRKQGIRKDFAVISLMSLVALFADGLIEIWGDGQRDLLKHLVMPNIFFDFVLIFTLNLIPGIISDLSKKISLTVKIFR